MRRQFEVQIEGCEAKKHAQRQGDADGSKFSSENMCDDSSAFVIHFEIFYELFYYKIQFIFASSDELTSSRQHGRPSLPRALEFRDATHVRKHPGI
jgi:hypothetical protein